MRGITVSIEDMDFNNSFFHYTNFINVESIFEKGLIPLRGENAFGLEKTDKVFFTIGFKGTLVLMDSWIKWLICKKSLDMPGTKLDKVVYKFGTFVASCPIKPNLIINGIINTSLKNKKIQNFAFQEMKNILDKSVFLRLNLKEKEDFDYIDIDEIKIQHFNKKMLRKVYAYNSNFYSNKMEYWNMHTYTDKIISNDKISLVKLNNTYNANKIIKYMVSNTNINIKKYLPYLYEYLLFLEKN